MNEALMTKSANVGMLSFLSNQVQDPALRHMLEQHSRMIQQNYIESVQILEGNAAQRRVLHRRPQRLPLRPKLVLNRLLMGIVRIFIHVMLYLPIRHCKDCRVAHTVCHVLMPLLQETAAFRQAETRCTDSVEQ